MLHRLMVPLVWLTLAGMACGQPPSAAPDSSESLAYDVAPWPIATSLVQPEYPMLGETAGLTGTVNARVFVAADGSVTECIASDDPHGLGFGDEVVKAVNQWSFIPAVRNHVFVPTETVLHFEFDLSDPPGSDARRDSLIAARTHWVKERNDLRLTDPRALYQPYPIIHLRYPVKSGCSRFPAR
jgi:TonB family protein